MTKVTKKELIKVAKISKLHVDEHETLACQQQLEDILSYAERVKQVSEDAQVPSNKNVNVFREDVVATNDADPLLKRAPQEESRYFVVPSILSTNQE